MLSFLFDPTPAMYFWAKRKWRLRAIKLRFRATLNISSHQSPRCATIPRKIGKKLEKKYSQKVFSPTGELFDFTVLIFKTWIMGSVTLNPKAGKEIASHSRGRMSRVVGRDRTVEIQSKLVLRAFFWGGVKTTNFPSAAREEWWLRFCTVYSQRLIRKYIG